MSSLRCYGKLSQAQALAARVPEALCPHAGLAQWAMQGTPCLGATPRREAEQILAIYRISTSLVAHNQTWDSMTQKTQAETMGNTHRQVHLCTPLPHHG